MKIIFVLAHPDDEAYGPAGTIAKLSKDHDVSVFTLCNGARPGSIHVLKSRQQSFNKSCEILGVDGYLGTQDDCTLTLPYVIRIIEQLVGAMHPDVVYTHNTSDLHQDHRIVGEAAMIACRPKPGGSIKELYMCENVATDWNFGVVGDPFIPNTFVDVCDTFEIKEQALMLYQTEVYPYPDARSIESVQALAMKRGSQVGVRYAEAFKQVFRLA